MYFCQEAHQKVTALILDKFVADWLNSRLRMGVDPVSWAPPTYRRYLAAMHGWAQEVECQPDELEACLFREIATERGGQWAQVGRHVAPTPRRRSAPTVAGPSPRRCGAGMTAN